MYMLRSFSMRVCDVKCTHLCILNIIYGSGYVICALYYANYALCVCM